MYGVRAGYANKSADKYVKKVMVAHIHTVHGDERGKCVCAVAIYGSWVSKPYNCGQRIGDRCLAGREGVAVWCWRQKDHF